ncbi:RDD family protein [Mycolicibacterium sp. P1-18]|nr:RDD family protein [Mycolicibacterium sp. P1-18]KAA0095501.1 RDD family protein [Mycolicibacterium sp. P1-18]
MTSGHPPYAPWWRRVVATVVDVLPVAALAVLAVALVWLTRNPSCDADPSVRDLGPQCGDAGATTLGRWCFAACWLAIVGYAAWNVGLRQGRSGSTVGKSLVKIRVLDAITRRPIGFWRSTIRLLTHLVDVVPAGVGFLWPLWDRRSQTFADKLTTTVVTGTR